MAADIKSSALGAELERTRKQVRARCGVAQLGSLRAEHPGKVSKSWCAVLSSIVAARSWPSRRRRRRSSRGRARCWWPTWRWPRCGAAARRRGGGGASAVCRRLHRRTVYKFLRLCHRHRRRLAQRHAADVQAQAVHERERLGAMLGAQLQELQVRSAEERSVAVQAGGRESSRSPSSRCCPGSRRAAPCVHFHTSRRGWRRRRTRPGARRPSATRW